MILHAVEAPNIVHTNTLAENLADIQEKDRYDIVLANPPFGGKERIEVQQNFPIKTGETAFLFLQHFIKILKARGKAGIVIDIPTGRTLYEKNADVPLPLASLTKAALALVVAEHFFHHGRRQDDRADRQGKSGNHWQTFGAAG